MSKLKDFDQLATFWIVFHRFIGDWTMETVFQQNTVAKKIMIYTGDVLYNITETQSIPLPDIGHNCSCEDDCSNCYDVKQHLIDEGKQLVLDK